MHHSYFLLFTSFDIGDLPNDITSALAKKDQAKQEKDSSKERPSPEDRVLPGGLNVIIGELFCVFGVCINDSKIQFLGYNMYFWGYIYIYMYQLIINVSIFQLSIWRSKKAL